MGGKSARTKGFSFEREIAIAFRKIGFPDARRQLEYQENQCKGIDLADTGRYKVQCKKLKAYASVNTIREIQITEFDRDAGDVPVLITAGDRQEPMACLPLKNFLELVHTENLHGAEISKTIRSANGSGVFK